MSGRTSVNPREKIVYLRHVGDPEKAWDPQDEDVLTGKKPRGDQRDRVLTIEWDGDKQKVRPGTLTRMMLGMAEYIVNRTYLHHVKKIQSPLDPAKTVEITEHEAPPLEIEDPEDDKSDTTAIGTVVEVAGKAKERKVRITRFQDKRDVVSKGSRLADVPTPNEVKSITTEEVRVEPANQPTDEQPRRGPGRPKNPKE